MKQTIGTRNSTERLSPEDAIVRKFAAAGIEKQNSKSETQRALASLKRGAAAGRTRGAGSGRSESGLRLGIGDDAALWSPRAGYETVLTCDWFLEGTHFLREKHPADSVGWKCLARAVSDIAAMGGEPRCFLLSLALPQACTGKWLNGFLAGLRRAQVALGCVLAGGDTTRSERILINVTVVGEVRRGKALRRSGAKPGDIIFVSGRLGEAELGLRHVRQARRAVSTSDPLLRKHLYPEPQLELGAWLAKTRIGTAAMDVSDGLSTDLARLCEASGVGARIEAEQVLRIAPHTAGNNAAKLKLALHGGDDYELLFTVAPRNARRVPTSFRGVKLTRVGAIRRDKLLMVHANGDEQVLDAGGWDPFRDG
jgi:thiamine-monophosphate kinase